MMKVFSVLVLFVFSASGYVIKINDLPVLRPSLAPSGWIHLQKVVLPLFENVCEESTDDTIVRLSREFLQTPGEFWDSNVLTNLQTLKTGKGFLQKGEIFSEYNTEHLNELKIVFDVLYGAKNFDTFIKAAAWARQNINCGLYVDALYLAFENRRDTEKLTLPPPYELLPNYFIRKDIIIQGSSLLAGQDINQSDGVRDEGNAYTLHANYTANFYDNDDESKLAYFREDVGVNTHYFLRMLKLAPWLNRDIDINSQYGENLYHLMKQWMARYNMERYSNGMLEEDGLNWDTFSNSVYDPMLVYSNGNEFIHRSSSINADDIDEKSLLKTIEENLPTVVIHMRESGYNKTQILNHLMEILVTSEKSYDSLARRVLGKSLSNDGNPSVLEHYMTSMRDPLFWKLNKKIVDIVDNSLKVLPPYSKNELYFPGVEVVSIMAKKIMTNFDYFQFDITDALKIGNGDTTFQVKIGQTRLNHKPFSIKLNISSLVTQKGLVKIYVGPKIMPGEFSQKKNQFGLLDYFEVNLKKGSNIITRSSSDNIEYSSDFMSYRTVVKKVEDAQFGLDSLPLNSMDKQTKFPDRMIIPKGTPEGLPLQLLVFVAPYMKAKVGGMYSNSNMEFNNAVLSKLYPMDLVFEDNMLLDLPNVLMRDISITHKGSGSGKPSSETGGDQKYYNSYSPPSRPNYGNDNSNNYYKYNGEQNQNLQFVPFDFIAPRNDNQNIPYEEQHDSPSSGIIPKVYESDSNDVNKMSFDNESKRPDYKSLYKNTRTTTTEIPAELDYNKMYEKNVVNYNNTNDHLNKDNISDKDNNDRIGNEQNISPKVRPKLYQSNPNYGYGKPSFDYKSKSSTRPQYNKVDYKSLYKNKRITTTDLPEEIDYNKMSENNIDNENDINNQLNENSINVQDNDNSVQNVKDLAVDELPDIMKNDLKENYLVIPLLKLSQLNSKSFYDNIRNVLDDDDESNFKK